MREAPDFTGHGDPNRSDRVGGQPNFGGYGDEFGFGTERTARFPGDGMNSERQLNFTGENAGLMDVGRPGANSNNPQINEEEKIRGHEKDIARKFNNFLKDKRKIKTKQIARQSKINKDVSLNENNIYKYEDMASKVEMSMLESGFGENRNLGKRLKLDYGVVDPHKKVKSSCPHQLNYKNFDLRYSTWYDSITHENEGKDPYDTYKGSLLVDMNDRSVLYDRLNTLLTNGNGTEGEGGEEGKNFDQLSDDENGQMQLKHLRDRNGVKSLNQ